MTFENALITLIGLYLDTSSLEPFLYNGFTLANLALDGNIPLLIVEFITFVRSFDKISANLTTTLGESNHFLTFF